MLDVACDSPLPGCHHCPVLVKIVFQTSPSVVEGAKSRCWSRGNYTAMSDELFEVDWELLFEGLNSAQCYQTFCEIVAGLVERVVPLKNVSSRDGWLARPPGSLMRRKKVAWESYKELRRRLGRNHLETQEAYWYHAALNIQYRNFSRNHQAMYEQKLVDLLKDAPKVFHSYLRAKKKGCPSVGPLRGYDGTLISNSKSPSGWEKAHPPNVVGLQSVYIIISAPPSATQPPSLDQS